MDSGEAAASVPAEVPHDGVQGDSNHDALPQTEAEKIVAGTISRCGELCASFSAKGVMIVDRTPQHILAVSSYSNQE